MWLATKPSAKAQIGPLQSHYQPSACHSGESRNRWGGGDCCGRRDGKRPRRCGWRQNLRRRLRSDPSKAITSLPLAILVNRGTAGAAEIVAAAVMENARGDVVGDKTFGEGSMQKLIDLPDGSALILSVAKYYSPSGKAIQDNAVTPNVMVASNDDDAGVLDEDDDEVAPEQEK